MARSPVFSCWDFMLNHGSVGGMLTSGTAQGQKAGEIIKAIFSGVKPEDIPVVAESPNKYMFDERILDRFNIKDSDLPKDSIIINKHLSFFSQNKKIVLAVLGFVFFQSLIILLLFQNITQRRKTQLALSRSEAKIKNSNSLLLSIIDSPPDINIWSVDKNYCYTFFNNTHKNGMKQVWGHDIEIGHNLFDYLEKTYRHSVEQRYKRALNGENFSIITKLERQDGSFVYYENYSSPIYNEENAIDGLTVFAMEITKRHMFENRIQESLREKEILLKEIHHRVKNNLQIISSMLNLQIDQIKNHDDRILFLDSLGRINSIALIHEMLYQSEYLDRINMQSYFTDLIFNLESTIGDLTKKINTIFRIDPIDLNINIAVPLGLLSNELITNCHKHAFVGIENPEIIVTMHTTPDNSFCLKIEDNGIGINQPTDVLSPKTLGFELINALVSQINGRYEVNHKNPGIEFIIHVPLDEMA